MLIYRGRNIATAGVIVPMRRRNIALILVNVEAKRGNIAINRGKAGALQ